MITILIIFILIVVYVFSIAGAMAEYVYEKNKVKNGDAVWVLIPVLNTLITVGYIFNIIVDTIRENINQDVEIKIKEDFKKKINKEYTTLQPPQYDKMAEIELKLDKFKLPHEAWLLILEWEKLKYEEGRYVGNVFPENKTMNNPIQCKQFFESIIDVADKLTSGNVAHHKLEIKHLAQRGIENLINKNE